MKTKLTDMKKVSILLLAVFAGLSLAAQKSSARVGIQGGGTFSNMYGELSGNNPNYSARFGYATGLVVDLPFKKGNFSFQPTLSYVQKGATTKEVKIQTDYVALRYAELAANFNYNLTPKQSYNLFLGAGPTFAANLPSKFVTKTLPDETKTETSVKWGKEAPADFKGIDLGVNTQLGLIFKSGIMVTANYTFGVRNLVPESAVASVNDKLNNASYGIRLAYLFRNN
jgi:hypothetical protein